MRAISLWQPHATAIALGLKPYETRSWATSYRGPLVICAAKKPFRERDFDTDWDWCVEARDRLAAAGVPLPQLPYGVALCIVDLIDCLPTEPLTKRLYPDERFWGDFGPQRFAFKLENVRLFDPPKPVVGHQGWFDVDMGIPMTVPVPAQLELFA
jgi:hypothetical protein